MKDTKKSKRTGRKMGEGKTFYVTLTAQDKDKHISHLWEIVKKYYSQSGESASVTCARVMLKGLTAEVDEILIKKNQTAKEELDRKQGDLFENERT